MIDLKIEWGIAGQVQDEMLLFWWRMEAYTVPSTVIDFNPLCAIAAPVNKNGIAHIVMLDYLVFVVVEQVCCTVEINIDCNPNLIYIDRRFNRM
jgi:hypothetical protein